jgi:hypothetical protein
MRQGEQKLHSLPGDVQQKIIAKYSSLEEFYFRVFYNSHLDYIAHKANDIASMKQLENELFEIQDELEEFGALDGHDITTAISSDFSENVAKKYVAKTLGDVGATEEAIRNFIQAHLR